MSLYTIAVSDNYNQKFNIEQDDPTLNGCDSNSLQNQFYFPKKEIDNLFLSKYQLEYITRYVQDRKIPFHIERFAQLLRAK